MSMAIMPAIILTSISILVSVALSVLGILSGMGLLPALISLGKALLSMYLMLFAISLITTITEWKKIDASALRKVLSVFTFPLFMFTYIPIQLCGTVYQGGMEAYPSQHYRKGSEQGLNFRVFALVPRGKNAYDRGRTKTRGRGRCITLSCAMMKEILFRHWKFT